MGKIDSLCRIEWVVFDSAIDYTDTLMTLQCLAAYLVTDLTTHLSK